MVLVLAVPEVLVGLVLVFADLADTVREDLSFVEQPDQNFRVLEEVLQ